MAEITTGLSDRPLDIGAAVATVSAPSNGAVALFVGTVRTSAGAEGNVGRAVVELDYDAHPELAPERLNEIAEDAVTKFDITHVVAIHRTGSCRVAEPTVVVACGAPHRAAALEACKWMIDTIKTTVPIWKREVYADGSSWVGAGS
jgi:molybdopterin synthase catalytic subunit